MVGEQFGEPLLPNIIESVRGLGAPESGVCKLSRPDVKLRQFQIESINFVSTQVADEQSRAVGGNIAPRTGGRTLESGQDFQIGQKLRASLADLYALKSGMVAERNVVVKPCGTDWSPTVMNSTA